MVTLLKKEENGKISIWLGCNVNSYRNTVVITDSVDPVRWRTMTTQVYRMTHDDDDI